MIQIANRTELERQAEDIPLVERLVECVMPGAHIRSVEPLLVGLECASPWIVFADEQGRGMALNLAGVVPNKTTLRQRLNWVDFARTVVRCFTTDPAHFPLRLQDTSSCPESWRHYQVKVGEGTLVCAASLPSPPIALQTHNQFDETVRVTLALQSCLVWRADISVGASQIFPDMPVVCVDQRCSGRLRISQEGTMTVAMMKHSDDIQAVSPQSLAIRVEIGEFELTLKELAGMRAGTLIELQSHFPLRCYLRIGTSTVGIGELVPADSGVRLTIQELLM
jgi:flagellar motor switch/type III secretory pathway protein FliN